MTHGFDAITATVGKSVARIKDVRNGQSDNFAIVQFTDGSELQIDGYAFDIEYRPAFITDRDPGDETEEPGYGPFV